MSEKSPLQSLKEWQELSEHFRSLYTSGLAAPENSLRVSVDSFIDPLTRKATIRAMWDLNGDKSTRETTFSLIDARNREDAALGAAKELCELISEAITNELYVDVMGILLKENGTMRNNLLSGLHNE